ncbi:hypothetical protein [Simkania sp.]|uniref:hypothetical protein n=1 Tax=Simkania sp. TaxID=34094 RepID=UPI003B5272D7
MRYLQLLRGTISEADLDLKTPQELIERFARGPRGLEQLFREKGNGFQCITVLDPNPELLALVKRQLRYSEGLAGSSSFLALPDRQNPMPKMLELEHEAPVSQPHIPPDFSISKLQQLRHPNIITSSSVSLTPQPTIDFSDELYWKLLHEHDMRPSHVIDHTLWEGRCPDSRCWLCRIVSGSS